MPTLDLSSTTYDRLLRTATSFEDTAEDVIVRLLDAVERSPLSADDPRARDAAAGSPADRPAPSSGARSGDSSKRAAPGSILPEREYWPAILAVLVEEGGSAHANDVIDAVGKRLQDRLQPRDLADLEIGEVRWRNRTRFARLRMKEAGLLHADSPRGVWEISDRGREYLNKPGRH